MKETHDLHGWTIRQKTGTAPENMKNLFGGKSDDALDRINNFQSIMVHVLAHRKAELLEALNLEEPSLRTLLMRHNSETNPRKKQEQHECIARLKDVYTRQAKLQPFKINIENGEMLIQQYLELQELEEILTDPYFKKTAHANSVATATSTLAASPRQTLRGWSTYLQSLCEKAWTKRQDEPQRQELVQARNIETIQTCITQGLSTVMSRLQIELTDIERMKCDLVNKRTEMVIEPLKHSMEIAQNHHRLDFFRTLIRGRIQAEHAPILLDMVEARKSQHIVYKGNWSMMLEELSS